MSLEWETYTIGESCDLLTGFPFKSKYYLVDGDFKVVRGDNVKTGFIKWDDKKRCWNDIDEKLKKYLLKNEDIVLAMDGNVGQNRAIISNNDLPALLAQRVACIRSKKDFDQNFIRYLIFSDNFRKYIDSIKTGTTINHISLKQISEYEFKAPDKITQQKIGQILRNIDDKININQEVNKNLEELAKTIYRLHFIDFEPYSQMNFISSALGEIPENWCVQSIGEFVDDMKNGGTPKRGESDYWDNGTVPWLKTGEINNNIIIKSEEYITELGLKNSSAKLLPINSIIMALYGKGTAARIGLLKLEATTNQACCAMICEDFNKTLFLYLFLLFNQKEIENLASGSVQQNLSKDLIANLELVVPPIEIIEKLPFKEIYEKISNNYFEIEYLTNLRDTLLPKLMSGEIDVSKINCDLKIIITVIYKQYNEVINMKTKLISKIQNQMEPYLNPEQYLKLTNSLLNTLKDIEITDKNNELSEIDNFKLLKLFLSAKQVEGCSDKTITYYKSTIEKMLGKIKKQVYNITTDDLRTYLFNHKAEKKSSKTTIDNIRRIFSSFFSWLEDEDYILKNPVRRIHRVKTGRVVKEVLSDENLEVLRDNCVEKRDLAIVELLTSTGIRVGELVRLNISDIDFYERECVVFGKGESERVVYFDARTKIHLIEYLQSRNDDNPALFVSLNKPHERLGISGIETRLRELGNKCNIKKVHPHKFRRTLATNAIDKGMPIEQVQKLLGHVQIDTTMQYAMVNQSNVKLAHRKFIG